MVQTFGSQVRRVFGSRSVITAAALKQQVPPCFLVFFQQLLKAQMHRAWSLTVLGRYKVLFDSIMVQSAPPGLHGQSRAFFKTSSVVFHLLCVIASPNFSHLVAWKGKIVSQMIVTIFLGGINLFQLFYPSIPMFICDLHLLEN